MKILILNRFWRLASKMPITHDVFHYIFEPPYSGLHFQVPVGHHVQFSLRVDLDETEHEEVTRYYTPTNESMKIVDEKDSRLHFLIKVCCDFLICMGQFDQFSKGIFSCKFVFCKLFVRSK